MSSEKVILIAFVVVSALAITFAYMDYTSWKEFSKTHNCKLVGKQRGETFTVIGIDGKVGFASTSDKSSYLCDDGVTYTR